LWDASRLEKIQYIKDVGENIRTPKFGSSTYDYQSGQLFVCCQHITVWDSVIDHNAEIKSLQVQTMSKNILRERKMLDHQDPSYNPKLESFNKRDIETKTGRVLVASASQLVSFVGVRKDNEIYMISVDSENLVRFWDMHTNSNVQSYRVMIDSRVTAIAVD
jgi:hypothetical protein